VVLSLFLSDLNATVRPLIKLALASWFSPTLWLAHDISTKCESLMPIINFAHLLSCQSPDYCAELTKPLRRQGPVKSDSKCVQPTALLGLRLAAPEHSFTKRTMESRCRDSLIFAEEALFQVSAARRATSTSVGRKSPGTSVESTSSQEQVPCVRNSLRGSAMYTVMLAGGDTTC
jgi:hypothetical protein